MVNYFDEFANTGEGDPPLPVPSKQNGVHVNFPRGAGDLRGRRAR